MQLDAVLSVLRAAGEETRLRLLALLAEADLTVSDLTEILGQSQPRISRHLKLLHDAGLIERYREGAFVFYALPRSGDVAQLLTTILQKFDARDVQLEHDRERLTKAREERDVAAKLYFSRVAGEWDRIRSLHIAERDVENAIRDAIGNVKVESHLDIGTGTGRLLELFAVQTQRSVGVDISPAMLSVARANIDRAKHRHVQVRPGDVYALPYAPASFDLITVHQVLHYLEEPARALKEAARVLKPGGQLLVVDFAPHDNEFLRDEFAHRRLGFAQDQMRTWLEEAGLQVCKMQDLPQQHTGVKTASLTVSLWLAQTHQLQKQNFNSTLGAAA